MKKRLTFKAGYLLAQIVTITLAGFLIISIITLISELAAILLTPYL